MFKYVFAIFQAGVSPLLQNQLEELAKQKHNEGLGLSKKNLVVIGQDCVEPLQALRRAGPEVIHQF